MRLGKTAYRKWKKRLIEIRGTSCQDCGRSFSQDDAFYMLDIDHVHPRSLGGKDEDCNARLLCRNCHVKKHTMKFKEK